MQRPSWALWVGVLMICIGGCSSINNVQALFIKEVATEQIKQVFKEEAKRDSIKFTGVDDARLAKRDSLNAAGLKEVEELISMSPYAEVWLKRFAIAGIIIGILYLLSGIGMLMRKNYSPTAAVCILLISIAFAVTQMVIYRQDDDPGTMVRMMGLAPILSIIIDVVLLIVLKLSDKAYYTDPNYGQDD